MNCLAPAILVVEAEPSNLRIACVLCAAGYEVTSVVGAAKAMKALEGPRPYALYVLDIESPAKRITAVAASIRRSQPEARILYFTAFSEALFALHGRLMPGREDLLEKSVSNQKVLEASLRLLFGQDTESDA